MHHLLGADCLVSSLSSINIGPGEVAQPIPCRRPVDATPEASPATRPTACGPSPTSPSERRYPHHPRHPRAGATRPSTGSTTTAAARRCGAAASSCGTDRCGTGAVPTPPTSTAWASRWNYCAGWVRQQENQQLGIPIDTVRSFSHELQELCGFGIYRGLIGHIDKRSPAEVLLDPAHRAPILWNAPDGATLTGDHDRVTNAACVRRHHPVPSATDVPVPRPAEMDRLPPPRDRCDRADVNLAFWQLRRLDERREFNAEVTSRSEQPVADFADVVRPDTDPDSVEWRTVRATGTYLVDQQIVVVNRGQHGQAASTSSPPSSSRTAGCCWSTAASWRNGTAPAPPSGTVTVEGRVRASQRRALGQLTDPARAASPRCSGSTSRASPSSCPRRRHRCTSTCSRPTPSQGAVPVPLPDPELSEGPTCPTRCSGSSQRVRPRGWVLAVRRSAKKYAAERESAATATPTSGPAVPDADAATMAPS